MDKKLKDFKSTFCLYCGSQRCTTEGEWLENCKLYQEYVKNIKSTKTTLKT